MSHPPEPAPPARWIVPTLFVAALVVYGATLGARDVWAEECFWVRDRPWDVLASFFAVDRWAGRPPLFYTVRSVFVAVLGIGPWGLRLLALLLGAASVPATFLLARRVLDARGAWVAALAVLLAALPGYFARESHVYSLSILMTALLGGMALDLARERDLGWRGPGLVVASLWSSLMLFPIVAILSVTGTYLRFRQGGKDAAVRFGGRQAAAWAGAMSIYGVAYLRLQARGGGLLEMGGEDGHGGLFDENNPLPTLVRAIDGMAFGPQGPLLGTSLEAALPLVTAFAVLLLCWSRGQSTWTLGGVAISGFLGGLLPFIALSVLFGHDHRLDGRYFVHLAPLVAIAWAAAVGGLPRRIRGLGEVLLLTTLLWGTVRAQSPPNRAMHELVHTVSSRARTGDVGFGAEDFFDAGISCLETLKIPRVEEVDVDGVDRVWMLQQKNDEDRFPESIRRAMPAGLAEAGFDLAFEQFVRPELHEEFGQIVLISRYDRGAQPRPSQRVTFEVDLGHWPITRRAESIRVFRLDHYPLRYRDDEAELVAELPLQRRGDRWVAELELAPEVPHDWELMVGDRLPGVGDWPPPLQQTPFTVYTLDDDQPAVVARPPIHWDPAFARLGGMAFLALLPLLGLGAILRVVRPR